MEYNRREHTMTKLPTWEQIAKDQDVQIGFLARRCAVAEGKDPQDVDALREILGAAQDFARERIASLRS
jgi:hypothetical protein